MFGCFVTANETREFPSPCYYAVKRHDDASGSEVKYDIMAESSVTIDSDIIVSYNFEPDGLWSSSSSEESNSDSDGSQVSFTEQLGNTSWCSCTKCVAMPRAIECTCCWELPEVEERFKESGARITSLEAFKTVCLDKEVLYTALVTMHTVRGDEVEKQISNR